MAFKSSGSPARLTSPKTPGWSCVAQQWLGGLWVWSVLISLLRQAEMQIGIPHNNNDDDDENNTFNTLSLASCSSLCIHVIFYTKYQKGLNKILKKPHPYSQ